MCKQTMSKILEVTCERNKPTQIKNVEERARYTNYNIPIILQEQDYLLTAKGEPPL